MTNDDTILVSTSKDGELRGFGSKEIKVGDLSKSVNHFLSRIKDVFNNTPEEIGGFRFTELVVSAEINTKGKLTLIGSGVETGLKGGLTFKFQRKS